MPPEDVLQPEEDGLRVAAAAALEVALQPGQAGRVQFVMGNLREGGGGKLIRHIFLFFLLFAKAEIRISKVEIHKVDAHKVEICKVEIRNLKKLRFLKLVFGGRHLVGVGEEDDIGRLRRHFVGHVSCQQLDWIPTFFFPL